MKWIIENECLGVALKKVSSFFKFEHGELTNKQHRWIINQSKSVQITLTIPATEFLFTLPKALRLMTEPHKEFSDS